MRPDFIIVGAMRSGTTTLQHFLDQHPDVFLAPGELHYFSSAQARDRGWDWYQSQFSSAESGQIVGEKSATYHYYPDVANRIHERLPEVKLVWIFRNPVERSYSHYKKVFANGGDSIDFPTAVDMEESRKASNPEQAYFERSLYDLQVDRYLQVFDRSQMHFVILEELNADPESVTRDLFEFLGVDATAPIARPERKNIQDRQPWSPALQRALRPLFKSGAPGGRHLRGANLRFGEPFPKLEPELRSAMQAKFAPHNERLSQLIGKDVGAWWR